MFKFYKISLLFITFYLLSACTIHRIDVQQGNIIKDEMVEKLKIGISKRQVEFIMGTPLIQDPFHANRWDYVFTMQPGDERRITEYRRVTLFFEGDNVVKIDKS